MRDFSDPKTYDHDGYGPAVPKSYQELTFADDFVFCKVLQGNVDLCQRLVSLVLGFDVSVVSVENQESIKITSDGRGVRLDVYAEGARGEVFDIEMQTTLRRNLPRRVRYYQGMIDLNTINAGDPYTKLRESYIIFICPFDLFGLGLLRYSFEERCNEDTSLRLEDGVHKVFLCKGKSEKGTSEGLKAFMHYVVTGVPTDEFTRELEREVEAARQNVEWRDEYMSLLMRDQEKREEGFRQGLQEGLQKGRQEGLQKGRQEGLQEGADLMVALVNALMADGYTFEGALAAAADGSVRERLCARYGIALSG